MSMNKSMTQWHKQRALLQGNIYLSSTCEQNVARSGLHGSRRFLGVGFSGSQEWVWILFSGSDSPVAIWQCLGPTQGSTCRTNTLAEDALTFDLAIIPWVPLQFVLVWFLCHHKSFRLCVWPFSIYCLIFLRLFCVENMSFFYRLLLLPPNYLKHLALP